MAPKKKSPPKPIEYEEVAKGVTKIVPYAEFRTNLLDHLGHEEVIKKIIAQLEIRKDADNFIWRSIYKNKWFWITIITSIVAISSLTIVVFPDESRYFFKKAINSKIPGLIP